MSQASIVELLRHEESSIQTQLSAIQQAIDAIELAEGGPSVSRRVASSAPSKPSETPGKRERKPRRPFSKEQREATSERMKKYWANRREQAGAAPAPKEQPVADEPGASVSASGPEAVAAEGAA